MAYTPSGRKPKSPINNFAGLPNDANRVAMPFGTSMLSQDATASPVVSPATNMSGSGVALTVPQNAVQFVINSSVAVQVGEDASFAQGFSVPANATQVFDCSQQAFIYVKPSSGVNTVSFYFNVV